MLNRHITPQLLSLAAQFPVVTILGPRQSGKTTLARMAFPRHEYLNLELPPLRLAARQDALGFFKAHPGPLMLDEIQHVPELLSHIQVMADEQRQKGQFILTCSHQPRLAAGISQSLAGRTGLLRLLPIEIKGGMTYDPWFARDLKTFLKLTAAESPTVIYAGEQTAFTEGVEYANFRDTAWILGALDEMEVPAPVTRPS